MKMPAVLLSIIMAVLPLALLAAPARASAAHAAVIPKQQPPADEFEYDLNGHCWLYDAGGDNFLTTSDSTCNYWDSTYSGTGWYEVYQNGNGQCLAWSTTRRVIQEETCSGSFSRSGQLFIFTRELTGQDNYLIAAENMPGADCLAANGDGNPVVSAGCADVSSQLWYAAG